LEDILVKTRLVKMDGIVFVKNVETKRARVANELCHFFMTHKGEVKNG
jgi:hypothetical protein